jgi:uncharacterized protein (DUF1501 family)
MAKRFIHIFRRGGAAAQSEIVGNADVPGVSDFYYRGQTVGGVDKRFPTAYVAAADTTALAGITNGYACNSVFGAFHRRWQHSTFRVAYYGSIGNPNPSRSHFYEQDRIDGGGLEYAGANSGWLNRWAGLVDVRSPAYNLDIITIGAQAARSSIGDETIYAATNTGASTLVGANVDRAAAVVDAGNALATTEGLAARLNFQSVHATHYAITALTLPAASTLPSAQVGSGVAYPNDPFGNRLKVLARMLAAGLTSRVICIDNDPGWDHHQNMGGSAGSPAGERLHNPMLKDFSDAMEAFIYDLEELDLADETMIMSQTEFHRTARENGSVGADHGHAGHAYIWGKDVTSGLYGAPLSFTENQNPLDPWPTTIFTDPGAWQNKANNRFLRYTFEYRDFQRMCLEWLRSARLTSPQMATIWGASFVSDVGNSLTAPQYASVAIT